MFDTNDIKQAVHRATTRFREVEDELNAADGKIGDGDTGQTMRRVTEAMLQASETETNDDIGVFLRKLGMAGASATGSSLGTLFSIGIMEMGKASKGHQQISAKDVAAALADAEKSMLARGGATLGDKTALDVLNTVHLQLKAEPENAPAALQAAQTALDAFRDKPCKMGRARAFGERSVGLDDPGMLAFVRLAEAIFQNGNSIKSPPPA